MGNLPTPRRPAGPFCTCLTRTLHPCHVPTPALTCNDMTWSLGRGQVRSTLQAAGRRVGVGSFNLALSMIAMGGCVWYTVCLLAAGHGQRGPSPPAPLPSMQRPESRLEGQRGSTLRVAFLRIRGLTRSSSRRLRLYPVTTWPGSGSGAEAHRAVPSSPASFRTRRALRRRQRRHACERARRAAMASG